MRRHLPGMLVGFLFGLAVGMIGTSPTRSRAVERGEVVVDMPTDGWRREVVRLRVVRESGSGDSFDHGTGNTSPAWVVTVPGRTYYAVRE